MILNHRSKLPLKIACVIGQLGLGGSEQQLYYFLRTVDRLKFQPEVWASSDGGLWHECIEELDINILPLYKYPKPLRPYIVWRLSKKRGIDVWWSWSYYSNLYANFLPRQIPAIGSLRGSLLTHRIPVGWKYLLCERRLRLMVVNSTDSAQELMRAGYKGKIAWIGNAAPVPADPEILKFRWRARLGLCPQDRLIVGAGKLDSNKNYQALLDAFAAQNLENVHLVIVGKGPERASLEARASQSDLRGRVTLLGEVKDAAQVIAAADVFVHTSRSEGMPNAVMEAIAAGIPVVATDVNGIHDLIPTEQEGWVVPQNNLHLLGVAIREAIEDRSLARCKALTAQKRQSSLYNPLRVTKYFEAWLTAIAQQDSEPPAFDFEPGM
jgi:glycosyltransferase involved in cell wall biosynthesis